MAAKRLRVTHPLQSSSTFISDHEGFLDVFVTIFNNISIVNHRVIQTAYTQRTGTQLTIPSSIITTIESLQRLNTLSFSLEDTIATIQE